MQDALARDDRDVAEIEADQYLVFSVGSQEFGVQAMWVQQITPILQTTAVPNAPDYIDGIINLGGRLVSTVNFRAKFGFESREHDEDGRIIIVEQTGFPVGVIVDSVEEVVKIPNDAVQTLHGTTPGDLSEEFITGVGVLGERLIILLDMKRVLAQAELDDPEAIRQAIEAAAAIDS